MQEKIQKLMENFLLETKKEMVEIISLNKIEEKNSSSKIA